MLCHRVSVQRLLPQPSPDEIRWERKIRHRKPVQQQDFENHYPSSLCYPRRWSGAEVGVNMWRGAGDFQISKFEFPNFQFSNFHIFKFQIAFFKLSFSKFHFLNCHEPHFSNFRISFFQFTNFDISNSKISINQKTETCQYSERSVCRPSTHFRISGSQI